MSAEDACKWDARYREGAYRQREHPAVWLRQRVLLPPGQERVRALDVACGLGRNARFLAGLGFSVDAIDISTEALAQAHELAVASALRDGAIRWLQQDLHAPLPAELSDYALIVVIRYLDLSLLAELARRLRPGGDLMCEVHLQAGQAGAGVAGPRGDQFRAAPGALRTAAVKAGLQIAEYHEGLLLDPDGKSVALAQLWARA